MRCPPVQRYYVLMGYALTAKPTTLHSEFYVAADADARIAGLERYVDILESQMDRETLKLCIQRRNDSTPNSR